MAVFIGINGSTQPSPLKIQKMRDAVKDLSSVLEKNKSLDPQGMAYSSVGSLLYDYSSLKRAIPYVGKSDVIFQGYEMEGNLRVGKEKVNQPLFFAANALKEAPVLPSVARKILESLISYKPSVYKRK